MLNIESAYAIRAIQVIAKHDDESLLSKEISEKTGISHTYLSKILEQLALAGVLNSRRGRGGGFSLTRPPHKINLSEVLAVTGGHENLDRCLLGSEQCDPKKPCSLHPLWKSTRNNFFRELNKMKLSALVKGKSKDKVKKT